MIRPSAKEQLHERNRFRAGYDFARLITASPRLAPFVAPNAYGDASIDYADPKAVTALNQALLKDAYGLDWDLPAGYLCPPVPGRSEYLHHLADLLGVGSASTPRRTSVAVLDVGMGANCIYPLIGAREYGWHFVGTEVDPVALTWAKELVSTVVRGSAAANAATSFVGAGWAVALGVPPPPPSTTPTDWLEGQPLAAAGKRLGGPTVVRQR